VAGSPRILFDARRGHQSIDAAKCGHRRFGHFGYLGFLGDVNGHKLRPSPQGLHTSQRFRGPGRLGRQIRHHHVRTLFGKADCCCLANARCPTSNDRDTLL
jgi:hypothetical protein